MSTSGLHTSMIKPVPDVSHGSKFSQYPLLAGEAGSYPWRSGPRSGLLCQESEISLFGWF